MRRRDRLNLRRSALGLATVLLAIAATAPQVLGQQKFRITPPPYSWPDRTEGLSPQDWPPFTHWDLREFPDCTVPWTMGSGLPPDLNGNSTAGDTTDVRMAHQAIEHAISRWDKVSPSKLNFVEVSSTAPHPTTFKEDRWNIITFSTTTALPRTANGGTVVWRNKDTGRITEADLMINTRTDSIPRLGFRKWVIQADHGTLDADIDYNPPGNWPDGPEDSDWNGNRHKEFQVDLGNTLTHEMGHFIGLAHCAPLGGASNDDLNPVMSEYNKMRIGPRGGGWTNVTLKDQDKDGENFLYCPDLGDAPDPCESGIDLGTYPSIVHYEFGRFLNDLFLDRPGLGAEHIFGIKPRQPTRNWTYEWLAVESTGNVDSECEANIEDRDPYDDGVTWVPNPPVWGRKLEVFEWARYASDDEGNAHDYLVNPLWANAWLDLNQNCVWEEAGEHFLDKRMFLGSPTGKNTVMLEKVSDKVTMPLILPNQTKPVWLRCRLDYGENSAAPGIDETLDEPAGAAQLGEVEDYKFYCTQHYESIFLCNPLPFPIPFFGIVWVGAPFAGDQAWSAKVTAGDCPTSINPAPTTTYVSASDETVTDFRVPGFLPPGAYGHFSVCRPGGFAPPETNPRAMMSTASVPATTPAIQVPPELRVPTVNCSYRVFGSTEPNSGHVLFTVGAVDFANGGWIDGPDTLTGAFTDTLRVTVAYRVTPNVIPIANLNLWDPLYSQYPLHPVGNGKVTPERAFEFLLSIPDNVPPGYRVILEVQSRWSANATVTNQLVEFPDPIGTPTRVHDTPVPAHLALENHPNPFNPTTTIRYSLPEPAMVTLQVFDVGGRLVRTLVHDTRKPAGMFDVEWNGTDTSGNPVASGVYFYRLTAGTETLTRKAVLLK